MCLFKGEGHCFFFTMMLIVYFLLIYIMFIRSMQLVWYLLSHFFHMCVSSDIIEQF